MNPEEKKKVRKKITAASIVLLVLVVGYLVYTIASGNSNETVFNIVVGVFLVLYWLLLDVAEPKLTGDLEGLDGTRMRAFYRSVLLGFAGYAGLLYFLVGIGNSSTGLLGVIVYVLTISAKRRAKEEYLGIADKQRAEDAGSRDGDAIDAGGYITDDENIMENSADEKVCGPDGGQDIKTEPEDYDACNREDTE